MIFGEIYSDNWRDGEVSGCMSERERERVCMYVCMYVYVRERVERVLNYIEKS